MKYVFMDSRDKLICGNPLCKKEIRKIRKCVDKLGFVCYDCANMSFVRKQDAIIRIQENQIEEMTQQLSLNSH